MSSKKPPTINNIAVLRKYRELGGTSLGLYVIYWLETYSSNLRKGIVVYGMSKKHCEFDAGLIDRRPWKSFGLKTVADVDIGSWNSSKMSSSVYLCRQKYCKTFMKIIDNFWVTLPKE